MGKISLVSRGKVKGNRETWDSGHVVGVVSMILSAGVVVACFVCVPFLINRLLFIKSNLITQMGDFKKSSNDLWSELMDLHQELRATRQAGYNGGGGGNRNGGFAGNLPQGYIPFPFIPNPAPNPPPTFGRGPTGFGPPNPSPSFGGGFPAPNNNYGTPPPTNFGTPPPNYGTPPPIAFTTPPTQYTAAPQQCQGAPGPAGIHGSDGMPGMPGDPGLPGKDGNSQAEVDDTGCQVCPQGRPGPPGGPGPPGANGPKGYQGDPGRASQDGQMDFNVGPPGPPGSPGRNGNPGFPGPPGKDVNGGRGQKGQKGFPGPQGPQGSPGRNGSPYFGPGNNGYPGQQGPTGPIGNPGPVGPLGPPGPRGQPGSDAQYCPCPNRPGPFNPITSPPLNPYGGGFQPQTNLGNNFNPNFQPQPPVFGGPNGIPPNVFGNPYPPPFQGGYQQQGKKK